MCRGSASFAWVKIYTRKGDDGSTGLLYGGRIGKDSLAIELNGAVDEAQAAIGLARADSAGELSDLCVSLERDLWVLMAEVATLPENRGKLKPGTTLVTLDMISRLEQVIDQFDGRFDMPTEFVIPGQNRISALFDVARTLTRRAERVSVPFVHMVGESQVGAYLNRLSDLLWVLARFAEGDHLLSRAVRN